MNMTTTTTARRHLDRAELEAGLDEIRRAPKDNGVLALIVRRPDVEPARGPRAGGRSTSSTASSATTGRRVAVARRRTARVTPRCSST